MKKNKLNYIKLLCVVVFLLIIIMLVINKTEKENYIEKFQYINSEEWNNEQYPKGMSNFITKYNGEIATISVGKSLYYVANEFFPKINIELRDAKEKDIRKYYNNNVKEILMILGSISEEEFVLLVNEITKIRNTDSKFEEYYFDIESIENNKNTVMGDLYIKYQDSDEIKVKISVIEYFKNEVSSIKYYK